MNKYIIICTISLFAFACKKSEELRKKTFPGFSGTGNEATWLVFKHATTDVPYLTSVMPLQTPPTTYAKYDSTIIASQQKEVSLFSFKFFKSGEIATIVNNNWVKQSNLKWETAGELMKIFKNNGTIWQEIITGFKDEEKLLLKFKKAFYGDISSDKERFVLEILYTIFN